MAAIKLVSYEPHTGTVEWEPVIYLYHAPTTSHSKKCMPTFIGHTS